jgi:hypothetical protein
LTKLIDQYPESLSAPGSEESGYSTIKSRQVSRSFFERPDIKALINPPLETSLDGYCVEVQIETNNSSNCGLEIRSIESKSLQTTIECSQKSVQINLSQEGIHEQINFSDRKDEAFEEEKNVPEEEVRQLIAEEHEALVTEEHEILIAEERKSLVVENQNLVLDDKESVLPFKEIEDNFGDNNQEISQTCQECNEITQKKCYDDKAKIKKKKRRISLKKLKRMLSFLSCFSSLPSNQ